MERPSGLKQAVRQGRLHSVCSLPYGLSGRTARKVSAPERRDCYPRSQLPRKRPLLQRGKQRIQRGQGAAVGGFEGFDGGDAGVGQTQVAAPPSASKAATSARNCGKSA